MENDPWWKIDSGDCLRDAHRGKRLAESGCSRDAELLSGPTVVMQRNQSVCALRVPCLLVGGTCRLACKKMSYGTCHGLDMTGILCNYRHESVRGAKKKNAKKPGGE
jgi:hypothetical protein